MVSAGILIPVMLGVAGLLMVIGGAVFTAVLCLRRKAVSRSSHEEGKYSATKKKGRNARRCAKGPVREMKRVRGPKVKMATHGNVDARGKSVTVGRGDRSRAGVEMVGNVAYGHVGEGGGGGVGSGDRAGVEMVGNVAYGHVGEGGGGAVGSGDRVGEEMMRNVAYGHVGEGRGMRMARSETVL